MLDDLGDNLGRWLRLLEVLYFGLIVLAHYILDNVFKIGHLRCLHDHAVVY